MEFRLAQPGVLRRFEGRWQLTATASGGCELAIQQEVGPPCLPCGRQTFEMTARRLS